MSRARVQIVIEHALLWVAVAVVTTQLGITGTSGMLVNMGIGVINGAVGVARFLDAN